MKVKNLALGAVLAAALCLTGMQTAQAELKQITIGTNPAGSTYYLLGSGFAKLFQEKLGIRSIAQPHAGSSVYIPLLNQGEVTLGLNSSLDLAMAINGKTPFKQPIKNVRLIARVWIIPYGFFVKGDSGIKSVEDLRGKRVIVNIKSNVSLGDLNRTILATGGLDSSSVKVMETGGLTQGIDAVVEGRADATAVAPTMPAMRQADAAVPGGARIVSLGGKATDAFMNEHTPGSRVMNTGPKSRLVGVKGPMKIAAFDSFVDAGTKVTDEDAYTLTKTIHQNWEQMRKSYPPFRNVKTEDLAPATNPMPYHPGAIKYWKEVGLWTPAHDRQQAKMMAAAK